MLLWQPQINKAKAWSHPMKRAALMITLLITITISGCVYVAAGGVMAGGGAYAWASGNLTRNYHQPLKTTTEGVLYALANQKIVVTEKGEDSHYGSIKGNMPDGNQEVVVNLEKWTGTETKVIVRVGALGDRELSEKIHKEIERALR